MFLHIDIPKWHSFGCIISISKNRFFGSPLLKILVENFQNHIMIFSVFLSILFSIFGFFIIFLVFNHQNNKKYIQYNERRLLSEKPSFLRTTYLSDLSNSLNRKYCKLSSVWPTTISNSTVEIPCPNGFTGFAYRYCSEEGVWKSSNYFNCFPNNSREIESDLYLKVKSLKKQTQLLQSTLSEQPLSIDRKSVV